MTTGVDQTRAPRAPKAKTVTLAHGGGGKAMKDLINEVFVAVFDEAGGKNLEDQARLVHQGLGETGAQLAFTTDSFVVHPLFFPGGDIGKLSICGTVNDLVVGGAKPLWISCAVIVEEGLPVEVLEQVARSMQATAESIGVRIVTGDTKVVEKGSADKLFITTSGLGIIPPRRELLASKVRPGDVAIVNGHLGNHGAAIIAARGDLALLTDIESDCQSLNTIMETLLEAAPRTVCARDATRGGLASAMNEIAQAANVGIEIDEEGLPILSEVRGVSEILGLDPLYMANEGTLVAFVPEDQAGAALNAIRRLPGGEGACAIGRAVPEHPGMVTMNTLFGGSRIVDMLVGEQLPRIC